MAFGMKMLHFHMDPHGIERDLLGTIGSLKHLNKFVSFEDLEAQAQGFPVT